MGQYMYIDLNHLLCLIADLATDTRILNVQTRQLFFSLILTSRITPNLLLHV